MKSLIIALFFGVLFATPSVARENLFPDLRDNPEPKPIHIKIGEPVILNVENGKVVGGEPECQYGCDQSNAYRELHKNQIGFGEIYNKCLQRIPINQKNIETLTCPDVADIIPKLDPDNTYRLISITGDRVLGVCLKYQKCKYKPEEFPMYIDHFSIDEVIFKNIDYSNYDLSGKLLK